MSARFRWAALVAICVLAGCTKSETPGVNVGLEIGDMAPEITGEDLHGEEFSLSEYRGKVVVLDFWGDW